MNLNLPINLYAKKIASGVLVFLFAYLMQRSICLDGLDLHHDLLMFDAARQMLHGAIPYKDFFYQYNLGTVFLHKISLGIQGEYIASLKVVTTFAYALIAAMIYFISVLLGSQRTGFFFAILWTLFSPFYMPAMNGYHAWATVYMMASVMLGLYFLLLGIYRGSLLFYFLSGSSFSLAFWFKQVAVIQILLVLLWFTYNFVKSIDKKNSIKTMSYFMLGGVIVAILPIAYLHQNNALFEWYRNVFEFNKIFSVTSPSGYGIFPFVKNLLPVSKDLGYISIIWALIPIYVVIRLVDDFELFFEENSLIKSAKTLIIILGLAGWIEYFPLAHGFHTQLFMAPIFCYFAIDFTGQPYKVGDPKTWLKLVMIFVLLLEVVAHVYGFYIKNNQVRQEIHTESPAKGLFLDVDTMAKYESFYKSLLVSINKGNEFLPMSADPIAALIPYGKAHNFPKWGMNWSWVNEFVNPGFGAQLVDKLKAGKNSVYSDELIVVPGYHALKVLEMLSPKTSSHFLYEQSKSTGDFKVSFKERVEVVILPRKLTSALLAVNNRYTKLSIMQESRENFIYSLYPILEDIEIGNVMDVNVCYLPDNNIPNQLNEFEYKLYVDKQSKIDFYPSVSLFYDKGAKGRWVLSANLTKSQKAKLGQFFLMTGKLLRAPNLPLFSSSLASNINTQPIIMSKHGLNYEVIWAKFLREPTQFLTKEDHFVAIPFLNEQLWAGTVFIQIVMKDNSTKDWYVRVDE